MSCPCSNKVTTELKCTNCGRLLPLRHHPDKEPLTIAQKLRKKCSKCGQGNFELLED